MQKDEYCTFCKHLQCQNIKKDRNDNLGKQTFIEKNELVYFILPYDTQIAKLKLPL